MLKACISDVNASLNKKTPKYSRTKLTKQWRFEQACTGAKYERAEKVISRRFRCLKWSSWHVQNGSVYYTLKWTHKMNI